MEEARANINNLLKIMTNSIFLSEFRDSQHTHTQCYYTSNSSGRWVLDASTCMFNTLSSTQSCDIECRSTNEQ